MNNYHIYEEIGRGKYSVVYKVRLCSHSFRAELKRLLSMLLLKVLRSEENRK